jgi:2-hydroxychromene-2-carboxylate isomerase
VNRDRSPDAVFFGDFGCAWTWLASRWIVDVAHRRDLRLRWRALPLAMVDDDHHRKPKYQQTRRAMRMTEALAAQGYDDVAGAYYTAYGTALHHEGRSADDELAVTAAVAAGVSRTDATAWVADDSLDSALQRAIDDAQRVAGPDVGSPVVQLVDAPRGWFGPVFTEPLDGDDGLAVWDALVRLARIEPLSEVKRGRPDKPRIQHR